MAYKDEKVVGILLEEAGKVEERCEGYHEELRDAVGDIMTAERQHKFVKMNITGKVGDIVGRVGTYLHKSGKTEA